MWTLPCSTTVSGRGGRHWLSCLSQNWATAAVELETSAWPSPPWPTWTGKLSHAWRSTQLNRTSAILPQVRFRRSLGNLSRISISILKTQTSAKPYLPAGRPVEFLPTMRTSIDSQGKIVVALQCVSDAAPQAVVSWSKGSEAVATGGRHEISSDTTQLKIRGYNVSNFVQQKYICTCRNPLGSQREDIQLQGRV